MDRVRQEVLFHSIQVDRAGNRIEQRPGRAILEIEDLGAAALEMVAIPGGFFQMGSPANSRFPEEAPRHPVSLQPFFIARSLITQAQWRTVMAKTLTFRFRDPNLPVENVSWAQAQEFCQRLSKKCGRAYRLPYEAEWEYACRAGTATVFSTGDTITTELANFCGDHTYLDEHRGLYRHTTTPGGAFPPNPFGIFDMHGNLWEWCLDRWQPDYSGTSFNGEPGQGSGERGYRVSRGGCWHDPPEFCRSAVRLQLAEDDHDDLFGFRVVSPTPPG